MDVTTITIPHIKLPKSLQGAVDDDLNHVFNGFISQVGVPKAGWMSTPDDTVIHTDTININPQEPDQPSLNAFTGAFVKYTSLMHGNDTLNP